jgi:hypothetical protein
VCPACGESTYAKQVTAAGFQLKGSGWYVTDFRGGNTAAGAKPAEGGGDKPAADGATPAAAPAPAAAAPAAASPAPAAAPAPSPATPGSGS